MPRDKYPSHQEIKPITYGLLISSDDYGKLLLSPHLPHLYSLNHSILCIYALYPKLSRITCYPCDLTSIYKVGFILKNQEFITNGEFLSFVKEARIIHTTGMSQHKDLYSVEYYFSCPHSWVELQSIVDMMLESDPTLQCYTEQIQLGDHHV